jgi:molybdopterin-guanine dinucleotide biosynthesis protein A
VKEANVPELKRAAPPTPHPPVDAPVRDDEVLAEMSARRRGIVPRSGGREAGRITVYVPPDLALRLRKYCFDHDRSITDVAGEVLIEALEGRLGS